MAIVVGSASAHRGHGDRQARLDGDRDSASNRCETQAGLDSTKTDTDANGTIDGLEDSDGDGANNAAESRLRTNCAVANKRFKLKKATVKSYSAEDGLTLAIGKRGLVTAAVSTNVVCEQDDVSDSSSDDKDTVACTTAELTEGSSVLGAKIKSGVFIKLRLAAADKGGVFRPRQRQRKIGGLASRCAKKRQ